MNQHEDERRKKILMEIEFGFKLMAEKAESAAEIEKEISVIMGELALISATIAKNIKILQEF